MMSTSDKLILWGAGAMMTLTAAFFIHRVSQTPKIAPWVLEMEVALNPKERTQAPPPPVPVFKRPEAVRLPYLPPDDAGSLRTRPIPREIQHPPMDVRLLPVPIYLLAEKVDRDGVTITWRLQPASAELQSWMKLKDPMPPTAIVVQRSLDGRAWEDLATLKGEAREYSDLTTLGRTTYHYRVVAKGQETELPTYPARLVPVSKAGEKTARANTPSALRVKLVGGDRERAILRVETWSKAKKDWVALRTTAALPGQAIDASGWTLKSLKFDNFTLVADATDDEGVAHVLTTKD